MKFVTQETGDWGESLLVFILKQKYESKGLKIKKCAKNNPGYDFIIEKGCRGTPFKNPSILSVKVRGNWDDLIPLPQRNGKIEVERMKAKGYDFWICFIKYIYVKDTISFKIYLAPDRIIDLEKDCKLVKRKYGQELQIISRIFMEKAPICYSSTALKN